MSVSQWELLGEKKSAALQTGVPLGSFSAMTRPFVGFSSLHPTPTTCQLTALTNARVSTRLAGFFLVGGVGGLSPKKAAFLNKQHTGQYRQIGAFCVPHQAECKK